MTCFKPASSFSCLVSLLSKLSLAFHFSHHGLQLQDVLLLFYGFYLFVVLLLSSVLPFPVHLLVFSGRSLSFLKMVILNSVRKSSDLHRLRVSHWGLILSCWRYRSCVVLPTRCLAFVFEHLKTQEPLWVSTDWLLQGKPLSIHLSETPGRPLVDPWTGTLVGVLRSLGG